MTAPGTGTDLHLNGRQVPDRVGGLDGRVATRRPTVFMVVGMAAVAGVWLAGCAWSFEEQTRFADSKGFALPWLLPLVIDGMAIAMATVATAASLDGRAAVAARVMTAVAIAASATSNATAAAERELGDLAAIVLAAGVPVAANLAFEVLLGEIRRQVVRRRGQPPPVPIPYPRPIRLALAPVRTSREWRRHVLGLTAMTASPPRAEPPSTPLAPATSRNIRDADTAHDPRIQQIAEWLANGQSITGKQVGDRFQVSARTGRRLLSRAETLNPSAATARRDPPTGTHH